MKQYFNWLVIKKVSGKSITYTAQHGFPVSESHVRNAPSVKIWAAGEDITVKPKYESR